MSTRAQPRIIARGAIRVDARRAAVKLREHLLVDLESYTLELARAAVALGAKRLSVRHDGNDVVIAFDGRPVVVTRLARLLDFALSDSDDPDEKALRRLALGVNAALGLDPSYVEVSAVESGRTHRVRFTPELLSEELSSPPQPVETTAPPEAFESGMVVAVRRKWLATVKRALDGERPREIELLAQATHDSDLAIVENGAPIAREPRAEALVAVPMSLPGATHAKLELRAEGRPTIELLERGVRLLSYFCSLYPEAFPIGGFNCAVRVVVDAPELSTNASRTALHEDSVLARELVPAAQRSFDLAIAALSSTVMRGTHEVTGAQVRTTDPNSLREALGALIAQIAKAGVVWTRAPALARLLELPLLTGVSGEGIPVQRVLGARSVYVWRDDESPPEHLGPWLREVVWLKGSAIERVLESVELLDAKDLLDQATLGASRRARLLSHPAGAPQVPHSDAELMRRRFDVDTGHLAGLQGEIVVLARVAEGTTIRVYIEGRMIEAIRLDPSTCPLSIDAAISWTELQPKFDYSGVQRNARLSEAMWGVIQLALGLIDHAVRSVGELTPVQREAYEKIVRAAIMTWRRAPQAFGYGMPDPAEFRSTYPGLFTVPVWPTTERDRRASIEELARYSNKTGTLCAVRSWQAESAMAAQDGRPVIVASPDDASLVAGILGHRVQVIPYERGVVSDTTPRRQAALLRYVMDERVRQGLGPVCPMLWLELPHQLIAVAPAFFAREIVCHRGVALASSKIDDARVPVIVAIDDDRIVPKPDWDGVLYRERVRQPAYDELYADRLCAAYEGDAAARAALGAAWDPRRYDPATAVFAFELSHALRASSSNEALCTRLERASLFVIMGEDGRPRAASIEEISQKHGQDVPMLAEPPGFETFDWMPLLAWHQREREAARKRFGNAYLAARDVEARQRIAIGERARRELLRRPAISIAELGTRSRPDEARVLLSAEESASHGADLEVLVALPHPQLATHRPSIHVHYMGRAICGIDRTRFDLPVAGNVDSKASTDFDEWSRISESGAARMRYRLTIAASELAAKCVEGASGPGAAGGLLNDPRALSLCIWLMTHGVGGTLQGRLLGEQFLWPTIQGAEVPIGKLENEDSQLFIGHTFYSRWLRPSGRESELDRPVLYVPHGETGQLTLELLAKLGFVVDDITEAAALLQKERGSQHESSPILAGMPPHGLVRTPLRRLGFDAGVGEIELIEDGASDLTVQLLNGRVVRLGVQLPCPIRAVVRIESVDDTELADRLSPALIAASERFVIELGPRLLELPRYVRRSAKNLITTRASAYDHALDALPIFEDTLGGWHSLQELEAERDLSYTTLDPPFPSLNAPCIRLSEDAARALAGRVKAELADHLVARRRDAEARRRAAPVTTLVLPPEERASCILTTSVGEESTMGEVGVLSAVRAELRGISLYVGRRSLCRIDDGPGWPLVALVNDDSVVPDPGFMGPSDPTAIAAVTERVRAGARRAWQRTCQAPPTAISSIWLDEESEGKFRITGCLWLPASFPLAPKVRVYTPLEAGPMLRPLEHGSSTLLSCALPIEGDLFVRSEASESGAAGQEDSVAQTLGEFAMLDSVYEAIGRLGARISVALLAEARRRGVVSNVVDEVAWNLALLELDASPPPARTPGGRVVAAAEVLAELRSRQQIWLSDGEGWVEGAFPGKAPGFLLADEGPLVRVLENRTQFGTLRRLGGVDTLVPPKADPAPADENAASVRVPPPPPRPRQMPDEAPETSWLTRLTTWLGIEDDATDARESPLAKRLEQVLADLALAGTPVESVVEARAKRPVRYDKKRKRVVIASNHPSLSKLFDGKLDESNALRVLAAAAVTEINRALQEVTDAEERRALQALLRDL